MQGIQSASFGYTPIQFMSPMINFIQTCPFLFLADESGQITAAPFPIQTVDGSALLYEGGSELETKDYKNGFISILLQANFMLQIRRSFISEVDNIDITDFLGAFEQWVRREDRIGNPPRFSMTDSSNKSVYPDESIRASRGMLMGQNDNPLFFIYQLQMQIKYMECYPKRGS